LTRALLSVGAAEVIAIERDRRCIEVLAPLVEVSNGRLRVLHEDALTVDIGALGRRPRHVVANLPYNVATPLLLGWLGRVDDWDDLTLMFQREVAERLLARPGTDAYGRLSIVVQWLAEARRQFDIPARAFTPPPKVTSTVVRLTPRSSPLAPADRAELERVTSAAFGQRRKMLRQSLRSLGEPEAILARAGIDGTRRAETLSVEEFCALARASVVTGPGAVP
jgi:16S rRNA (adenine1518-N6/adenine1519-N6)-dimethyltransferase